MSLSYRQTRNVFQFPENWKKQQEQHIVLHYEEYGLQGTKQLES